MIDKMQPNKQNLNKQSITVDVIKFKTATELFSSKIRELTTANEEIDNTK